MSKRGKFIVIEGNDGAGKTTQCRLLFQYLQKSGIDIVLTKEPGGIPETLSLRNLILHQRLSGDGMAQLLLFAADRRLHLLLQVTPQLDAGKTVISDRYYGSTRVYQRERKVPSKYILALEQMALMFDGKRVEADVTILLDVDSDISVRRKRRQKKTNYFDEDQNARQRARARDYRRLAKKLGWIVVDGTGTREEVFNKILTQLKKRRILR